MKTPLVLLLVLSLAGNAVLAVVMMSRGAASAAPPASVPLAAAVSTGGPPPAAAETTTPAVAAAPATPAPATWQSLQSGRDLHALVANLRSAGFPPSVVRSVVRQMISDQMDRSALERMPFWKQNFNNPEYQAAQAAINTRTREQFEAVLGPDARPSASLDPATRLRRYGNLSDDKIDRLETLNREFGELGSQLYAQRRTTDVQGMMAVQRTMEEERQQELLTFLTPAEIEQYEMRSSPASSRVASSLKTIDVTEQEFAELFRAQKAFDSADPMRSGQPPSTDAMARRNQAQDTLNEQARATLGEERFYEYLKGSDPNYARAAQALTNFASVTPAQTYELVRLEREYQAAVMGLARSGGGGPQAASALRQEFQNNVNALVGEDAGKAFVQRNRAPTVISTGTPRPAGP